MAEKDKMIKKIKEEIRELKEKLKQEKKKPREEKNKNEIKELKELIKAKRMKIKAIKKNIKMLEAGQEEQKIDDGEKNDLDEDNKNIEENQTKKDKQDNGIKDNNIEESDKEDNNNFQSNSEFKLTLSGWQIRAGIEIVPDDYIRYRSDKFLTEQEFKDILKYENVPKLVREPGSAEKFLRTQDDWNSMRTSMDTLKQAISRGDFPKEVDENDYILLQYSKGEIHDETGDGYIGLEDVDMKTGDMQTFEKIQEKIPKDCNFERAKDIYDKAILEIGQTALTESIMNEDLGVGESAVATVFATLNHDLEHDGEEERDEEGEIMIAPPTDE